MMTVVVVVVVASAGAVGLLDPLSHFVLAVNLPIGRPGCAF